MAAGLWRQDAEQQCGPAWRVWQARTAAAQCAARIHPSPPTLERPPPARENRSDPARRERRSGSCAAPVVRARPTTSRLRKAGEPSRSCAADFRVPGAPLRGDRRAAGSGPRASGAFEAALDRIDGGIHRLVLGRALLIERGHTRASLGVIRHPEVFDRHESAREAIAIQTASRKQSRAILEIADGVRE